MATIYTIGHSNHEPNEFLSLLHLVDTNTLVDIRSNPNSTWAKFANRDNLEKLLYSAGIKYEYMGNTLGGLPSDQGSYDWKTGKADYNVMKENESFKKSILKLLDESKKQNICLLCAEENPAQCHRNLLVGFALNQFKANILHIRGNGRIQTDEELYKERAGVSSNQQRLAL